MHLLNDYPDRYISKIFIRREDNGIREAYSQGTVMSWHATYECRYVEIPGRPVSIYNGDGSQGD